MFLWLQTAPFLQIFLRVPCRIQSTCRLVPQFLKSFSSSKIQWIIKLGIEIRVMRILVALPVPSTVDIISPTLYLPCTLFFISVSLIYLFMKALENQCGYHIHPYYWGPPHRPLQSLPISVVRVPICLSWPLTLLLKNVAQHSSIFQKMVVIEVTWLFFRHSVY